MNPIAMETMNNTHYIKTGNKPSISELELTFFLMNTAGKMLVFFYIFMNIFKYRLTKDVFETFMFSWRY